jgi:hypothetical protein
MLHNKSLQLSSSGDNFKVYLAINSSGNCLLLQPETNGVRQILYSQLIVKLELFYLPGKLKCNIISTHSQIFFYWKEILLRLWMYIFWL